MYKTRSRYIQYGVESGKGIHEPIRFTLRETEKKMVAKRLKVGSVYDGRIEKIMNHGANVNISGLWTYLHISEISDEWLDHPSKKLSINQIVPVVVISNEIDQKDRVSIKVSMKRVINSVKN